MEASQILCGRIGYVVQVYRVNYVEKVVVLLFAGVFHGGKPSVTPVAVFALCGLLTGFLMLIPKSSGVLGALLLALFSLGPTLSVTMVLAAYLPQRWPQILLGIAGIASSACFAWAYLDVFHWHSDPQSPVGLIFVGVYSLPLLIPIWLLAFAARRYRI